MLIRSLACCLIVASSVLLVFGQPPGSQKADADMSAKTSGITQKLRDLPMPNGINLQFIIRELANDIELNVVFDSASISPHQRVAIDLKNVTTSTALDFIYAKEGLFFVEIAPKTILVASKTRTSPLSHIGLGIVPLTKQLTEYFGVEGGLLISSVHDDSPASKAGINPGDLIVDIDGVTFKNNLDFVRAIKEKKERAVSLKILRDRKDKTVTLLVPKGVESWLQNYTPKPSE